MANYGSYKKISSENIVDASLTSANINTSAVTAAKLAAQQIGTNQLAANIDLGAKSVTYRPLVNADIDASAGISTAKVSGLAASATTDTTDAGNITTGLLNEARIASLNASKLTGSLPAVDGSSLTNVGERVELFYYSVDGVTQSSSSYTQSFEFTTTFAGTFMFAWMFSYRPDGSLGNAFHYFTPELLNTSNSVLTSFTTFGAGAQGSLSSLGWNQGGGSIVYDYNGPRPAGTYRVRLYHNSANNATAAGDEGRELHYIIWNVKS